MFSRFFHAGRLSAFACLALLLSSCATVMSGKEIAGEYYALAEGYVEIAKYDKAIPYYQKAAQRNEYRNAAEFGLARAYALSGKWNDSYELLSRLHGIDPDNVLVGTAYAYALVNVGRIDEALALYSSLCAARSDDSVLARNYAELLFLASRYEEAGYEIAWIKSQFPDSDGAKDIAALEKKLESAVAPKPASTPKTLNIRGGPWDAGSLAFAASPANAPASGTSASSANAPVVGASASPAGGPDAASPPVKQ